jgi:virginiamycin B lyase
VITAFPPPTGARGITTGPDGALWFAEEAASQIGRITIAGVITEFPIPTPCCNTSPIGITTGPDGALWFTEYTNGSIGRITTAGVITVFPDGGGPFGITTGPDGASASCH